MPKEAEHQQDVEQNFVMPSVPDKLTLTFNTGGEESSVVITEGTARVGRMLGSRLHFQYPRVSDLHAKVYWDCAKKSWFLEDTNSTFGTKLNGKVVRPGRPAKMHDEDVVTLAKQGKIGVQITEFPERPTWGEMAAAIIDHEKSIAIEKLEAEAILLHTNYTNQIDGPYDAAGIPDDLRVY